MDLPQCLLDPMAGLPLRVVRFEFGQIGDPPPMVTRPVLAGKLPVELPPRDPLTGLDRLEHRAVGRPPPADVVNRGHSRGPLKRLKRAKEVGAVDVVADLLAAVSEDRVRRP